MLGPADEPGPDPLGPRSSLPGWGFRGTRGVEPRTIPWGDGDPGRSARRFSVMQPLPVTNRPLPLRTRTGPMRRACERRLSAPFIPELTGTLTGERRQP